MAGIVARKVRETGDSVTLHVTDSMRTVAEKAINQYLALPLSNPDETGEDTFKFWRDYSITTDKAQKALCHLARLYLTPAPTSTDVERLFSTAGGEKSHINRYLLYHINLTLVCAMQARLKIT